MTKTIKALVVGDYLSPIHEEAICKGLQNNGVQVHQFKFSDYLKFDNFFSRKLNNLQLKLQQGPAIYQINKDLKKKIAAQKYDFIFFYRPRIVSPSALSCISKDTVTFCYNNDDPFSFLYNKHYWSRYFKGLKYYTHIFYYRNKNREDYHNAGFQNSSLLRSYYIKELNFPIEAPKQYDVVFIGHYEDDGRDDDLKHLIDNGVPLKIFGPEWSRSKYYSFFTEKMGAIVPVRKEYNATINASKIALVFLSTLNSDTYTRRCFEIPATKTFMLAQYTDDLNSMFEAGREADYFSSKEELLQKINAYLQNESQMYQVGTAGFERLLTDGHEVTDRALQIINTYKKILATDIIH